MKPSVFNRFLSTALFVGLLFSLGSVQAEITWLTDHETAHKTAKEQGKPLMVDLWAEWCVPCKELAKHTFTHPEVVPLFDGFVLAKLDLTDFEDPLWKTYKVSNLPVVAFFQPDGTRLEEFDLTEKEEGPAFATRLRKVRAKLNLATPEQAVPTTDTTPTENTEKKKLDDGTTARETAHKAHPSLSTIAETARASRPRIHASLITSHDVIKPGDELDVAIHLSMHPHWHTYWKYTSSGLGPTVEWGGPTDTAFGETRWSAPLPLAGGGDFGPQFGYESEQVLTTTLKVGSDLRESFEISAKVMWQVCHTTKGCIPGRATLTTNVHVGDASSEGPHKDVIHHPGRTNVAQADTGEAELCEEGIGAQPCAATVTLPTDTANRSDTPVFVPLVHPSLEISDIEIAKIDANWSASFEIDATEIPLVSPWDLGGVFHFTAQPDGSGPLAFQVSRTVEPTIGQGSPPVAPARESEVGGIWSLILLAFLGGLILNIMPCVLPILSIKALGLVQQAEDSRKRIWHHGLMYGFGVLASFWVLAGLVIFLKSSGESANWGFQLESPIFVIGMLVMLFAFALSLFGVFEFTLGQQAAGKAANKKGLSGSFLNGIFATMLGTPCTAPMLAPAAGFALSQPAHMVVVFFTAAGLGFALPFVAIARFPAWSRWIPKPGAWMEHFKKAMAFMLIGAAIWLLDVLTGLTSVDSVWWIIVFLGVLSLALWMYGAFAGFMASPKQRWIVSLVSLALVVGAGTLVFPVDPPPEKYYETDAQGDAVFEEQGFTWKVFSPELMTRLSQEGKTVFLDFTSKQCWTCKANKKRVVYTDAFQEALEKYDVVAVRGDNTNGDPDIEEWLKIYQSAGVPLNVVFPPGAGKTEGILLDTWLELDECVTEFETAAQSGS